MALPHLLAALFVATLLPPLSVWADQAGGTAGGSIIGTVSDATGAVLPGVTITISSDALTGTRTAVTHKEGLYRIPALPPGEYTLVFTLAGFRTVKREGTHVGLGFTATIDVELDVAALQESLTVTRKSPVIDKQSTAIAAIFDARQLADLPGARSMNSIIAATPAVQVTRFDVGGNTEHTGLYGAYGTSGQNRPLVEGMNCPESALASH